MNRIEYSQFQSQRNVERHCVTSKLKLRYTLCTLNDCFTYVRLVLSQYTIYTWTRFCVSLCADLHTAIHNAVIDIGDVDVSILLRCVSHKSRLCLLIHNENQLLQSRASSGVPSPLTLYWLKYQYAGNLWLSHNNTIKTLRSAFKRLMCVFA